MKGVKESPVWLERQQHLESAQAARPAFAGPPVQPELLPTTLHTSILMARSSSCTTRSRYWYPTLLGQMHHPLLPFLAAFNVGAIVGAIACGRLSEGRSAAAARPLATLIGVLVDPALRVHDQHLAVAGSARSRWDFSARATSASCPAI